MSDAFGWTGKPTRHENRVGKNAVWKNSDGIFGHITCKRQHIPTQTD
ncbi:hypothetical protein [Neisseria meningitidis]|nr:hypothetical protein [Neisseria meningitidis]MBW3991802.1 hypothetical protein [Neisseria meningitidis]MCG3352213.1 hypothetical protein [Neisseria meningitidis]MCG3356287.1 hypothetical protein [Neisseria meningitidis]MCG3357938.1 hypothetical protein [Neisseria meningitidis]MCG3359288.1 hypothetical protein [Neisseria meningitidis]